MTNTQPGMGSKVGRARRTFGQLWQVPTFLLGVLAFVGVAVSAPWRLTPQQREFEQLVRTLRQALENDEPGNVLVGHAENLKLRQASFPGRAGETHFLIGSAYYRQGKQQPARATWARAVEQLEKAASTGVAPADQAAMHYRLGYALYQQNLDVPRALQLMTDAVEKGAEQPLSAYQLLTQARLNRAPPEIDAARAAVRRILDLTPERDIEAKAAARVLHAELLLRKEMRGEAVKELERIGPKAPRSVRVKARLLQARCAEEEGHWHKAIPIWQDLLADAVEVNGGRGRILYALGLCHLQSDAPGVADAVRVWSEAVKLGGAEGQAAALRLGNLRLSPVAMDPAQALADWKLALEHVQAPKDYRNPYVTLEQMRDWLDAAIDHFQEAQDPERTQVVAELYRKIMPGGVAEERVAIAVEARAKQLADRLRAGEGGVKPADVESQYARAGAAFEQAADARPVAARPDVLWRGIQCYLNGKADAKALKLLHDYVRLEAREPRLAEAWLTVGDLYRLADNKRFAHDAYVTCIECGKTPYAYRARYWLAVEQELDTKNLDKARAILQDNLSNSAGDVDRAWQEKSAFKMAALLMKMKNYNDALDQLKECLLQFPENTNALLAREQLGECYRNLAEAERKKERALEAMITINLSEERERTLRAGVEQQRKTRLQLLTNALATYQRLADELEARPRVPGQELSTLEQTLLRRARFYIGECHYDAEQHRPALDCFLNLQEKHRRTLEGFFASHRITSIASLIPPSPQADKARADALTSVRMLLEDLKAMPSDDDIFRLPGVKTHDAWRREAEETQRKLLTAPKTDTGLPALR